jgi:hypothetical protein
MDGWFGPVAAADYGGSLVGDIAEFGLGEAGGAAEGEEGFRRRAAPVIDLTAELAVFIKLHHRGHGAVFGGDYKRLDKSGVGAELEYFLQTEKRMAEVVEDAEKQDDIEAPEAVGGELADIESEVFDARLEQGAGFEEGVELDAIDSYDLSSAAFALEAEPAVPGADVEDAFAAEVLRQTEEGEAPAEVVDGLEAGED